MLSIYRIELDTHSAISQAEIEFKRGDGARQVRFTLWENGNILSLENCTAYISLPAVGPDGAAGLYGREVDGNITGLEIRGNTVYYNAGSEITCAPGVYECELVIYGPDGKCITSPRFTVIVRDCLNDPAGTGNAGRIVKAFSNPTVSSEETDAGVLVTFHYLDADGNPAEEEIEIYDGVDGRNGRDGNGIERIEATGEGTDGDGRHYTEYTVFFDDGAFRDYRVTDGKDGESFTAGDGISISDGNISARILGHNPLKVTDPGGSLYVDTDNALDDISQNPVRNSVICAALAEKQDRITAGNGISISGSTVSADTTGYAIQHSTKPITSGGVYDVAACKQNKPAAVTGTVRGTETVAVADNTEYRLVLADGADVTFTFPYGISYDAWILLTVEEGARYTFSLSPVRYIGRAPLPAAGETWEISVKDGVIVSGKAVSGQ